MAKGPAFTNAFLQLIFNAVGIANLADNTATSPLTNLYVALHTADPTTTAGSGTINTQNASEATYTGYARVAVARTSGGWTVASETVYPVATISFGACTGGTNTITNMSVGTASSGTGVLLYSGTVTPNISVSNGVTPQLTGGVSETVITES